MATAAQRIPGSGDDITLWGSFRRAVRASGLPWAMIAPALIIMLILTFLPQAYQILLSFYDYRAEHLGGAPAPFVTFENFRDVLIDGLNVPNYDFFAILGFNIVWTFVNVFFHVLIGMAVAMALNAKHVIGRRVYRTIFLLPWAMPIYIVGLIWNGFWQQNGGAVNLIAESANDNLGTDLPTNTNWLGELMPPVDVRSAVPAFIILVSVLLLAWLTRMTIRKGITNPKTGKIARERLFYTAVVGALAALALFTLLADLNGSNEAGNAFVRLFDRAGGPVLAFYSVLIANIWLGWPFMMVVATGALQSIPPDLYEAADVDGASKWQQFASITLPLLRPAMVPAIMLGTIWTFNQFNVIFFITGGGPSGQTDLLITQAYKLIQQESIYGKAAAFSIIVFFVLFIITMINNRITRATESYDAA